MSSDTTPVTTNHPRTCAASTDQLTPTHFLSHTLFNDVFSDDDSTSTADEMGELTPRNYSDLNERAKDGSFDLCGSMYKRRGGLGRNAENSWILRCFTLYGPILCYHTESSISSVSDPSNPRARLNLLKTETIAEMHSKHKPGLPTEFLLTVNIYNPLGGKRKWEMCCTSKEQQVVWYNAINAYDGKVNRSSTQLARTPSYDDGEMDGVVLSPTEARGTVLAMPDIGDGLVRPRLNTGGSGALTMQDVEVVAKAAAKAAVSMCQENTQKDEVSPGNVILFIVVLNTASYWIRNGSEQSYKITLFFMNAFVLYIATQKMGSPKSTLKGPKARAAKQKKQKSTLGPSTPSSTLPTKQKRKSAKLLPVGSTIPKNTQQPHSYANSDSSIFKLRIGPNYKKNKQKGPSGPALYELHSMDFIYADSALKRTADKFVIPTIPGVTDISTEHSHIPPLLIINTWLPGEEPSLFAKPTDGETYSIPMVFVITKDTLDQLKDLDNASPAVKLWSEWCKRAEGDEGFRGRFKCMGMIEDIDSTG